MNMAMQTGGFGQAMEGKKKGKKWTTASDKAWDKKHGVKQGSKTDKALDKKRGVSNARKSK